MKRFLYGLLRALLLFAVFDVVGVGLTLACAALASVHAVWETSAALGYVVWFVVGVFCGLANYPLERPDSADGRRAGITALASVAAGALLTAVAASFFWSANEGTEPVVPDHQGVTVTFLVTVVVTVAAARFVLFRPSTPRQVEAPTLERAHAPRAEVPHTVDEVFRPSGFGGTVGFVLGVPVLLFFDVSMFLLGPFDLFDRWTGPLLCTALVGGALWGLAAARWEGPRDWLSKAHAPLLIGTVFYFFGLLPGALIAAIGGPSWLADGTPLACFCIGFALGCVAWAGAFAEWWETRRSAGNPKRFDHASRLPKK